MRNNLYNPTMPQSFKAGMVFKGGGGDKGGVEVAAPPQPTASPGFAPGQVIQPALPTGFAGGQLNQPPPLSPGQALTQNTGLASRPSYTDMPQRTPLPSPQGGPMDWAKIFKGGGPGSTPGTRFGANSGGK